MADLDASSSRQTMPTNGALDVSRPMEGLVVCFTNVSEPKRTQLTEYAIQMGAIHEPNLENHVTHLVVSGPNVAGERTPKYLFVAQERPDVRPMTESWIEAIREFWINDRDEDLDMGVLEKEHTLPIFRGLKISMTGCDDTKERVEISTLVREHGGIYSGDLTKDDITHLIAFRPEGPKYNAARKWGLTIVSSEWFRDCVERGMLLQEDLYNPLLPREQRGKGAWNRSRPKRRSLSNKRTRTDSETEGGRRKMIRTVSSRLNSQSQKVWEEIIGGGKVVQASRSGSVETIEKESLPQDSATATNPANESARSHLTATMVESEPVPKGIFGNCRFYLHGFPEAKTKILYNHLLSNEGEVVETTEELLVNSTPSTRLFMIVSHDLPIAELPKLPETELQIHTLTFWWIERCLFYQKFFDPLLDNVGQPFSAFPVQGFAGLTISTSAFGGIELLHVKRGIELVGGTFSEDFTPKCSLMLTRDPSSIRKEKLDCALEWNIPIILENWLWDSLKEGTMLSTKGYCYRPKKPFGIGSVPNKSRGVLEKGVSKPERTKSDPTRSAKAPASTAQRSKSDPKRPSSTSDHKPDSTEKAREAKKLLPADRDPFESASTSTAATTSQTQDSQAPKLSKKRSRNVWIDDSAFTQDEPTVKEEEESQDSLPKTCEPKKGDTAEDIIKKYRGTVLGGGGKLPSEIVGEGEIDSNSPPPKEEEEETQDPPSNHTNTHSQDPSLKLEPLTELDANSQSPSRTVSTAPAPSDHPNSKPSLDEISSTISSLLAKTKTGTTTNAPISADSKPQDQPPRKQRSRILGRVASNLSTTSSSTSTPIEYPPTNDSTLSLSPHPQPPNSQFNKLMNQNLPEQDIDSQPPPATQLGYEDPESTEARELVMARMEGKKDIGKKGAGRKMKGKAVTVGDFREKVVRGRRKKGVPEFR